MRALLGLSLALTLAMAPATARGEEPRALRGWIGIGGRNSIGASPIDPDFGAYVFGGVWLVDEHVQTFVRAGWSRGGGHGIIVDDVRTGAGLALGGDLLGGRLWLGGAAGVEGIAAFAHGGADTTSWGAAIPFAAIVQGRIGERFLLGLDAGPELWPAPMRFAGPQGTVHWGSLRFNGGLLVGVVLGDPG